MKKFLLVASVLLAVSATCAAGCSAEKNKTKDEKPYGLIQELPSIPEEIENKTQENLPEVKHDPLVRPRSPRKPRRIDDNEHNLHREPRINKGEKPER